jgi:hypothetical protein
MSCSGCYSAGRWPGTPDKPRLPAAAGCGPLAGGRLRACSSGSDGPEGCGRSVSWLGISRSGGRRRGGRWRLRPCCGRGPSVPRRCAARRRGRAGRRMPAGRGRWRRGTEPAGHHARPVLAAGTSSLGTIPSSLTAAGSKSFANELPDIVHDLSGIPSRQRPSAPNPATVAGVPG